MTRRVSNAPIPAPDSEPTLARRQTQHETAAQAVTRRALSAARMRRLHAENVALRAELARIYAEADELCRWLEREAESSDGGLERPGFPDDFLEAIRGTWARAEYASGARRDV